MNEQLILIIVGFMYGLIGYYNGRRDEKLDVYVGLISMTTAFLVLLLIRLIVNK